MNNSSKQTEGSSTDIGDWRPEDEKFWETTGKRIAYRNLWISVPALLCGFAIWGMWGIITVQMLNLGFPFSQAELFSLTAISGLAGATMRIPASFLIRLSGGRNTIFLTTAMLLAPAIGTGIALQHPEWPLWVFQLMALWSGVGGGKGHHGLSRASPRQCQTCVNDDDKAPAGDRRHAGLQRCRPLRLTRGFWPRYRLGIQSCR